MGRYIKWDDVVDRYPDVARGNGADSMGTAHITYAESFIDGRLSVKYTTPFTGTIPVTVKDLCIELVYIRIGNMAIEARKELLNELYARIDGILSGKENIIDASGNTVAQSTTTVWSNTMNYHPTFGMNDSKWLRVDSAQLEDEADEWE